MRVASLSLVLLGLSACVAVELLAVAATASPASDDPVLVVAPPWGGGAAEVVRLAGGRALGPTDAPLSVLAEGASAEAFRAAGAWFLLDPAALTIICGKESADG